MIFVWTSRVSSRHFGLSRMSFTCFGSRYVRGIGLEGSWRVGLCEVERNIFHLKLIQAIPAKLEMASVKLSDIICRYEDQSISGDFAEWKWVDGEPKLKNRCPEYAVPDRHREEYDSEVQQWVSDGWLEPYNAQVHGKADGIIPLMAAEQPNKPKKVRPACDGLSRAERACEK